jgi:FUN14 domain-containing protein 1
VQVDWKRVEKDVNKAKRHLKKKADRAVPELNSFIDQVALHLLYSAHVTNSI